ncbi:hypothetical protein [Bradyrhizobium sp. LTSPM299]|uniref:hypothetical protein n=1 Tax=Bradyrhizobium sp. LTSPM299 TaxID=1619233 RepID=UPI0006798E98|nr:hypothetical protein [Bradyrhizobium sp. LTSPM299]
MPTLKQTSGALPSRCSNCGFVFISNDFGATESTGAAFINNVTQCQRCGRPARVVDGKFDFVENAIRVVHAPQETIEILRVLQTALDEARQGKPEAEVVSTIEASSPELAVAIKKKMSAGGALTALLLTLLASCSNSTTLNWNQLVDQVHVYATGQEPYPRLTPLAAPAEEPEARPKQTRQQRRHQERQEAKKARQQRPQQPKKPKH